MLTSLTCPSVPMFSDTKFPAQFICCCLMALALLTATGCTQIQSIFGESDEAKATRLKCESLREKILAESVCDQRFNSLGEPLAWFEPQKVETKFGRVKPGESLALTLTRMGLTNQESNGVIFALKNKNFDFRRSRPDDQIRLVFEDSIPTAMEYRASASQRWIASRPKDKDAPFVAEEVRIAVTTEVATVDITIESSLYEAIRGAKEDPGLAMDIADVFAWDIDFYRDLRRGDRLRLVVEKKRVQDQFIGYGEILGVRYLGGLVGDKAYLLYNTEGGSSGYFGADGQNAKKAFLKSPLKYTFVTSNYGGRQHPVLGFYKAHQGVDLRAAVGTPVWSVADGTVTKTAILDRVAGTYVFIRHTNGLETTYLHLSKLADGIRPGVRVQQKQVVGYSGNTGRSTGPHLHYGMRRGGVYIDPFSQNFPRAKPLPKEELERFLTKTQATRQILDQM